MNKIKIDNGNAPLPCPSHGRGFLFVPSMTGGYALLAPVCNLSPLFPSVTHSGAYWPIPISIPMNRKKKDRVIIPLIAPPPHTLAAKQGRVPWSLLSLCPLKPCKCTARGVLPVWPRVALTTRFHHSAAQPPFFPCEALFIFPIGVKRPALSWGRWQGHSHGAMQAPTKHSARPHKVQRRARQVQARRVKNKRPHGVRSLCCEIRGWINRRFRSNREPCRLCGAFQRFRPGGYAARVRSGRTPW